MTVSRSLTRLLPAWRKLHKALTICVLVALLAGLIPPPLVRSALPVSVANAVADLLPASAVAQAASAITGVVYHDYNNNGMRNTTSVAPNFAIDVGVAGVTVTAYDAANTQVGQTTSGSDGAYSLAATGSGPYRIEFSTLPADYEPAFHGPSNVGSVQFVAGSDASDINFGVIKACDYCQNGAKVASNIYNQFAQPSANKKAVILFDYGAGCVDDDLNGVCDVSGQNAATPTSTQLAAAQSVGTTWGMAYQRGADNLFVAAYMKRHAGFKTNGATGVIYRINNATGSPSLVEHVNFDALGIDTGADPHPADNASLVTWETDANSWDWVGKMSFGDLDIAEDGATLYTINLFDRKLYAFPARTAPAITVGDITAYTLPQPASCPNPTTNLRPFGLGVRNGLVYVGMLCSGESSQSTADMRGYVYSMDLTNNTNTEVLNFALNYPRTCVTGSPTGACYQAEWKPWKNSFALQRTGVFNGEYAYPQPMVTDIVFDNNGDMILGLRDRVADQSGFQVRNTAGGYDGSLSYSGNSGGDLLRACVSGGSYTLENNGQCGSRTTNGRYTGTNSALFSGPGNGEYYYEEKYPDHQEISMGGLALLPGGTEVAMSVFDPIHRSNAYFDGGVIWMRNVTGDRSRNWISFSSNSGDLSGLSNDVYQLGTFAKAGGMGDMELLCDPAPLEIGNRVWKDGDGDGIQDAGEPGIEGVTVQLTQTGGGTTSTTTDASGYYYFSVDPEMGYTITVDMTQNKLEGYTDSPANATGITTNAPITDVHDSDYTLSGSLATIAYTTGTAGQSNHSLDFGFIAPAIKLGIAKQNSPTGVVLPGSMINYTVVLTGNNSTIQTNPALSDPLPDGTTFVSGSGAISGYQSTVSTGAISDNFSTSNYAGGSGWSDAAWMEVGESDGIAAGSIRVVTGAVNCPSPTVSPCLAVVANMVGRGIERGLNLAGATAASVKIAVDPGTGSVQVSLMDGATPTVLGTINTNGTHTFAVPTALLKSGVKLRFSVIATGGSFHSVDNIAVDVTSYQLQTQSGVTPANFLGAPNDFVVSSQYPLTLTYQAQVDSAAVLPGGLAVINNTAQATSAQVVDPVYDTVTNTTGIVIIGNYVWHDVDQDGSQDAEEAPIADVSVELVDGSNNVVDTAVTDATGAYYFQSPELAANTAYTIRILLNQVALTGYIPTALNTPGNTELDSDGDPSLTAGYVAVNVTSGAIGTYDYSYDFGFYQEDWGDLPDGTVGTGVGNYQTSTNDNGPHHGIRTGLTISATVDAETNGQPNGTATGDGVDEDGVTFGDLARGSTGIVQVSVVNTLSVPAVLYGFIDFNNDGVFAASETVTATVEANKSINVSLSFAVPWDAAVSTPVGARFRLSTDANLGPNGLASDGEVEDYLLTISQPTDWGDLTDVGGANGVINDLEETYLNYDTSAGSSGPVHTIIENFYMGAVVDAEADSVQSFHPTANGDDRSIPDLSDEDGVTFGEFRLGHTTQVTVTVVNGDNDLAYVNAFFDFNGDGEFADAGETFTETVTGDGTVIFAIPVPIDTERDLQLGARFRLSKSGGLTATGAAADGEVEDYLFNLVMAADWGDLPDNGTGTGAQDYQTLMADNGPNHVLVGGLQLGANEDSEDGGQPDSTATGDDTAGLPNDEDAATFPTATDFVRGQSVNITVTAINTTGVAATLYGFIDFNNNGVLTDTGEMVTVNVPGNTNSLTPFVLTFAVPLDVTSDTPLGARFRLSTDGALIATGPATNGEVEDYLITVAGRGELQVRKTVDWNLATANPTLPFTVTIYGPSYPAGITETVVAGDVISFSNVFAGVYTVTEGTLPNAPTGFLWAAENYTPTNGVINLTANSTGVVTIANALMPVPITYAAIEVNKTVDGAPALAGWEFTLSSSNCLLPGALTNPITTVDGTGGTVSWRDLLVADSGGQACEYTVDETPQSGYTLNLALSSNLTGLALTPNVTTSLTVVNVQDLVSIGNLVWEDGNDNGLYDSGEDLIDNLAMELWVDLDNDGIAEPLGDDGSTPMSTTVTVNGIYSFTDLLPDAYFVRIPNPPAVTPLSSIPSDAPDNGVDNDDNGSQPAGPNTQILSPVITLVAGEEPGQSGGGNDDMTVDFGLVDPFLGNLVWYDKNNDGVVDADEPGLPGVTVQLFYDADDSGTIDTGETTPFRTTTTDDDGIYVFPDLVPASNYQVVIPQSNFAAGGALALYRYSSDNTDSNDNQEDEDDNGVQASPGLTTTAPLVRLTVDEEPIDGGAETGRGNDLDNGDDNNGDMTIDFGFYSMGTIQIVKQATGGDDTFTFSSADGDLDGLSLTTSGGVASSAVITKMVGTYTISETAPAGWHLIGISVSGDSDNGSTKNLANGAIALDLDANELLVVTFKNIKGTLPTGSSVLTITKSVVGDPGSITSYNVAIDGSTGYYTETTVTPGTPTVLTGLAAGLYTVTETSPGAGWVMTYTVDAVVSNTNGVVDLTNVLNVTPVTAGPISGKVFRDFNSDGQITANGLITDTGVSGVTVTAYDKNGNSVGSVTANSTGDYTINPTGDGPYRVEFSNLPTGYEPTTHGTDNGTSTQFVTTVGGASNINLGINQPCDYCQANPFVAVARQENGSGVGNTHAGYLTFATDSSGASPNPTTIAQLQEVGSVWGNAFQRESKTLFASTFVKRHVGFGPTGIGGVYLFTMDTATGAGALLGSFDLQGVIPANSGTTIDLGSVTRTNVSSISAGAAGDFQLPSTPTAPSRDMGGFAMVGKASFGDIDLSSDGDTLWLVNLNQKALIAIDVAKMDLLPTNGAKVPGGLVRTYPIAGAGVPNCGSDGLRPWGLKITNGRGYLGVVCDAAVSRSTANLNGYVLSFDETNPTSFTQEVAIPFTYTREPLSISGPQWTSGAWSTYFVGSATWAPWANTWSQNRPQPIIADIEFDLAGNMTLGVMDRASQEGGNDNYEAVSGSTITTSVTSAGDILRVCKNGSAWTVECSDSDNNAALTPITEDGALSTDGPGGAGEFYYNDYFYNHTNQWLEVFHWEITTGGLAYYPVANEIATTVFDPLTGTPRNLGTDALFRTQGVDWYSASDGSKQRGYQLVSSAPNADPTTFGKANGLGDLELLCNPAPIEIGNRVWDDIDGDGIQDPGEPGLNGVQVSLQGPTNTVNVNTSGDGNYYFTVRPNTEYTITVATPSGYALTLGNEDSVDGLSASSNHAISDTRDSDAILVGGVATIHYTTGSAGQNNHGLDFGFTQPVNGQVDIVNEAPSAPKVSLGNRVWYDTNNDSSVTSGEQNVVDGVVVELYQDSDGSGAFSAGDSRVASTVTSGGYYTFTDLTPSSSDATRYLVVITDTNFLFDGLLYGYHSSDDAVTDNSNASDNDKDHGALLGTLGQAGGVVASSVISLTAGTQPTGEANEGNDPIQSSSDANSNQTIDFGFYSLSVGNRVWLDDGAGIAANADNGQLDTDETGIDGVTVELLDSANNVVSTTGTNNYGRYTFTGLISGTYSVRISGYPATYRSSTDTVNASAPTSADDDDNGPGTGTGTLTSQPFALVPGSSANGHSANNATGVTNNPRIDFGLYEVPASFALDKRLVSPVSGVAAVGDSVIYDLVITNTGSITLTSVTLVDSYDADYLQYNSASPAPTAQATGVLTWTVTSPTDPLPLSAGETMTVTVTFTAIKP